ncbi:MAG: quinoprotein dehydrogenase-associated SoxYZ-like carrier [Rubrivivax sp.]|nr:quinoprotein dehydrogenase-associated SoxYZ-like carrier [Rubrivivax sp.]
MHRILMSAAALLIWLGQGAVAAQLQPTDDPATSPVWLKVKASFFDGRTVEPAPAGMLTLEIPRRAVDAAVVPVAIRASFAHTPASYVKALYLVIDANPSPLSAVFQFTPESGSADVETRVRIDAYSHVRAIAETSDGRLYGVTHFVKASGGCSAPAGADAQAAQARMGQMHLRVDGSLDGPAPVLAQLAIEHPNHSGLAMDQATRQFTPAHFVRKVEVTYDGKPVFAADVDFSIAENPNFRFHFVPHGGGVLKATVVDSQDLRFVSTQVLGAAAR